MSIGNGRRTVQLVVLIATVLGILGLATTGLIYPYFFCYSCPWDVGNCPIGIAEHGFVDIQITFWSGLAMLAYLAGFMMLMGVILGRAFCGWACPIGLLQDATRKLGISQKVRNKLRASISPAFRYVKYLILAAIPVTAYLSRDLFYTNLCPVGGVTGTIPTLLFYTSEWTFGSSFPVKLTSMVLFFLLIILVARGWCKYLCPIGAFLAPWNGVCRVGVTRDAGTCTDCNLCERKCPMDVKEIGKKPDPECILCGRCAEACRSNSLRFGVLPFRPNRVVAAWVALLVISSSMLAAGAVFDGYSRADKINSLPCLGCLALDPYRVSEWRVSAEAQPQFVSEALASRPVFLHYRTDVCPGCDEMEPHIAILEEQYGGSIEFIHINLDHATSEQDASYDIYDFAGTPTARFGVPMFATVISVINGTQPEIQFNTQYGSSADQGESKRLELEETVLDAILRHVPAASPVTPVSPTRATVFSELFVDTGCVNCYKSEEALVEMEHGNELNFVTFVTDAPGVSGAYGTYREGGYVSELAPPVLGHPWVVFAGGPGEEMGALTTAAALADYRAETAAASLAQANITVSGSMSGSGGTMFANITVSNQGDTEEPVLIEVFLIEKLSRWLNLQGDPIPNAFVDLVDNSTYTIQAGGNQGIEIAWTGNEALQFSDMRIGNIGLVVVAWQGDAQITAEMLEPTEQDLLFLSADETTKSALPNGTADFAFRLYNYWESAMTINVSIEKPANWDATISEIPASIPANGNTSFTVYLTGNGTASSDPTSYFTVKAVDVADPTVQDSASVSVKVKDDITPPTVVNSIHEPALPRADQAVNVTVVVGDAGGVDSVRISYFSCTPEACSPYFIADMNLTSANTYTASVYPIGTDHTDFHYRIIATDMYNNTATTDLYDVELEPVAHHAEAEAKPKWIGVVLLIVFAVLAVSVALAGRRKPPETRFEVVGRHGKV